MTLGIWCERDQSQSGGAEIFGDFLKYLLQAELFISAVA